MAKTSYGAGTIFRRGRVWYVSLWVDGRQLQKSSGSERRQDAVLLRDQLLGKKARGETPDTIAARVTCGELLDDLLAYAEVNIKPTTAHVWKLCIDANVRPFFGHLRAASLTTAKLQEYRRQRVTAGRSEATANRELSILRTALNRGRKCTPPKVLIIPYFPDGRRDERETGISDGRTIRQIARRAARVPATAVRDGVLYRRAARRVAAD